jgi:Tol biopolymer transport system component
VLRAADKEIDLDGNPINGEESRVETSLLQTFPVKVENVVHNNTWGSPFNFSWPGAGPGGFDSILTVGPDVGTKWEWTTLSQVYSVQTPMMFELGGRELPTFGAPGGGVQVVGGVPEGIRAFGPRAMTTQRDMAPALDARATRTTDSSRAATAIKLSPDGTVGAVSSFAVSPDGKQVVYLADHDSAGLIELYVVPADGSASATKLSSGLSYVTGANGVALLQVASDSSTVVFLADAGSVAGDNDIYSVSIDGSAAPVKLNSAAQAPVTALGLTPDGSTAVFFGEDTILGDGAVELFKATLGVASSGVQLSAVGSSMNLGGNVVAADFSPDSANVFFAADSVIEGAFQWHSVPMSSSGPGAGVLLTSAINFVTLGTVTPDSSTLVYAGDVNSPGVVELFSVPLSGGSSTQLSPAMAGNGVNRFEISSDGTRVAYLADQVTPDVVELFGAQIGVAASGVRLNGALSGTQEVDSLTLAPDSVTALYESDETTAGTFELRSVAIDGTTGPVTLDPLTAPASAGSFSGLGTPVVGGSAVYPIVGSVVTLHSVPFDGSSSSVQINAPLAAGESVFAAFIPDPSGRLVAYGSRSTAGVAVESLFVATARGDFTAEQVNVTALAGSLGIINFAVTSDERYAIYSQDQQTAGKVELYSASLDTDGDSVLNAADNCPFVANLAQGSIVFGPTLTATGKDSFEWAAVADVRFVRGPLSGVSTLQTDWSGALVAASGLIDPVAPSAGAGAYYLVAPDCDGRSYQTSLGAEPARDASGLP